MGWRGTAIGPNTGAANMCVTQSRVHTGVMNSMLTPCSGDYFFLAGPLLLISGLLEFLLGNTFTFVVFVSYCESGSKVQVCQRVRH